MKKRVLLLHGNLMPGGIERCLVNFANSMKYFLDIDILLFNKEGELLNQLDSNLKVVEASGDLKSRFPVAPKIKLQAKTKLGGIVREKVLNVLYGLGFRKKAIKTLIARQPQVETEYDAVFCFHGNSLICGEFALEKVRAKKKFALIHSDLSKVKIPPFVVRNLTKFDRILCVSESISDQMKRLLPKCEKKVDFLYNFLDTEAIIKDSKEQEVKLSDVFNLVSVSRLSVEKAIPRTLSVLKKLKNEGFKFHYTIVGDGPERIGIEQCVGCLGLDDCVTLVGAQANPYPFIKSADLFMLNSYHEAAPIVTGEALTLGIPVFVTETCSTKELIGDYGFICHNSRRGIYSSLKEFFLNPNKLEEMKVRVEEYRYPNKEIREKVLEVIE